MHTNPLRTVERHFNIFGSSPRVVKFVIVKMVKTKQTKQKSEAEKDRRKKYKIAKVPSRFGTAAKVATHDPPVLPGRPGSLRNLPLYSGKYLIQSKLNNVYVEGLKEIIIHIPVVCLFMSKGSKVHIRNVIVLQ